MWAAGERNGILRFRRPCVRGCAGSVAPQLARASRTTDVVESFATSRRRCHKASRHPALEHVAARHSAGGHDNETACGSEESRDAARTNVSKTNTDTATRAAACQARTQSCEAGPDGGSCRQAGTKTGNTYERARCGIFRRVLQARTRRAGLDEPTRRRADQSGWTLRSASVGSHTRRGAASRRRCRR
jgi:hypothetical protein